MHKNTILQAQSHDPRITCLGIRLRAKQILLLGIHLPIKTFAFYALAFTQRIAFSDIYHPTKN